jgi:hypothetical protein
MSYTLENLFAFSNNEITQILNYFNHEITTDENINRLNAIILSHNNGLLVPNDENMYNRQISIN